MYIIHRVLTCYVNNKENECSRVSPASEPFLPTTHDSIYHERNTRRLHTCITSSLFSVRPSTVEIFQQCSLLLCILCIYVLRARTTTIRVLVLVLASTRVRVHLVIPRNNQILLFIICALPPPVSAPVSPPRRS